jgi:HPt (histidine-containing phosphotransfer) domain-containing protein
VIPALSTSTMFGLVVGLAGVVLVAVVLVVVRGKGSGFEPKPNRTEEKPRSERASSSDSAPPARPRSQKGPADSTGKKPRNKDHKTPVPDRATAQDVSAQNPGKKKKSAAAVQKEVVQSILSIGGDEATSATAKRFVDELEGQVHKVRDAIANKNLEELADASRELFTTSGTLGAVRLAEVCLAIQQNCSDGSMEAAPGLYRNLEHEFRKVKKRLDAEQQQ